ncbi:MAG: extracellular solute-binding protein [Chloroflexi bacterium]|nr:extracellular solute-binding protein [Chloroflexota bacterium]
MARIPLALLVSLIAGILTACLAAPAPRQPAVIRVAAIVYPGGGAPPGILSLYEAAMAVNKAAAGEYEIKIQQIMPTMPQGPMKEPSKEPPMVTALEEALLQDPRPDVVFFSSSYEHNFAVKRGLVQPLDAYLRGDQSLKPDEYFPGALEALRSDGQLYGLPLTAMPLLIQYDQRVFDAAGLPAPDGAWDWQAFLETAKRLTKVGDTETVYGLNLTNANALIAFIWQNGGDVVTKDGKRSTLAEPPAVEAMAFLRDLIHTYKVAPPPFDKSNARAMEQVRRVMPAVGPGDVPPIMGPFGRVAMQFMSAGIYFGPFNQTSSPVRMTEMPKGKVRATTMDLQSVLALTAQAPNGRQAYRAMVALAGSMGSGASDVGIPVRRSAAKNLHQVRPQFSEQDLQVIARSMEYAQALPIGLQNTLMPLLYQKLLQPIQEGKKSAAEIAQEAAEAIDTALNTEESTPGGIVAPMPAMPAVAPAPAPTAAPSRP